MINAINIIPCKTAGCPTMGDYAIKKKMNVSWGGNGRVCDAGHYNRFGNIRADEKRYAKSNVKKSTIQVLRVKE